MEVIKTLSPGVNGTKRYVKLYGNKLVCVRYRIDKSTGDRFTTIELGDLETRITQAAGQALELELTIFTKLCTAILDKSGEITDAAHALARLDVAAALAELAADANWVRPKIDNSRKFEIFNGRHPVVEAALEHAGGGPFVANDCAMGPDTDGAVNLWLVTGPNMAGKSTFLRQNALIAILAQMGAYVPADSAHIGIIDRLFSRVGAADDLARGRSTFMVEMVEAAAILNQAGPRSLVILDELGRGTATHDGLSIAWAAIEHLHEINTCRTLFATHYHELTALSERLADLGNLTMRVKEWEGDVVFLHEVTQGAADRSYGLAVAKLAGLPPAVLERAREVLTALETGEMGNRGPGAEQLVAGLPLFSAALPVDTVSAPSPVVGALKDIDPDDLTPREAQDALYRLKRLADEAAD